MKYSISIIIPILNEINSLKKTLLIINKIKVEKEFIIIFSQKLTSNLVKNEIVCLKKKYKNLKYFKQIKPFVGGAINTGIIKAKKKFIAIMASDMETNPYELKNMIKMSIENNKSIICADRWIGGSRFMNYGVVKYIFNFLFQKLIQFFYNYKILDYTFAYRIYPQNALKRTKFKELRHGFALEILLSAIKKGYPIMNVKAKWKKRIEGNSSITLMSYMSFLKVFFRNL
jgi:glycosyltransferase involved in cell wall biosynthesis